jgi:CRISPR-associated protein Csh1
MFYQQSNNFFKIINIIPEIPESRILNIVRNLNQVHNEFKQMFPSLENLLNINIQEFYKTMVFSSSEKKYKEALGIIVDLFKFQKIEEIKILKLYLDGISNYYHKNGRIYENEIILMNAYIKFLMKIGLLIYRRENNHITVGEEDMKEDEFIENAEYTDEQKSLFWIGYAIKKIGNVQFMNHITSNPILEKINYQGMNFNALEKLVNQIDEKIKQYGVYGKDMRYALFMVHSIMSKYSLNSSKWPINDVSNVFLIMTGYSVTYQLGITNKEEIDNGEENEN